MTPSSAGRTGGLTRSAAPGAAERQAWASRGGRLAMCLGAVPGIPVVMLVAGKLVEIVDPDPTQLRAMASLRAQELARRRWDKHGNEQQNGGEDGN